MSSPMRVRERSSASSANLGPLKFAYEPIESLRAAETRPRKHGRKQLSLLKHNIKRLGCLVPILITEDREIIDGHLIWEACKALKLPTVPVVVIAHLSPAEVKALRISISAIAELGEWDDPALKLDLDFICRVDPTLVTVTALPTARIDQLMLTGLEPEDHGDDDVPEPPSIPVSRRGDLFLCGDHRLLCGDATNPVDIATAVGSHSVDMLFSDIPYGMVPIKGVVSQSHGEFVQGSSITPAETLDLFQRFLGACLPRVADGSGVFLFIDHRAMQVLTQAAEGAQLRHLCTAVWDKGAGGRGGLYKHQVEFVRIREQERRDLNEPQLLGSKFGTLNDIPAVRRLAMNTPTSGRRRLPF